jgi:hypothetical protein
MKSKPLPKILPAIKGKRVCKTHGGRSTGPKTEAGRQRCAQAKTIHARETHKTRNERSLASARLAVLELVGHQLGFMNGNRTRGRKPSQMAIALNDMVPLQRLFKARIKQNPIQKDWKIILGQASRNLASTGI